MNAFCLSALLTSHKSILPVPNSIYQIFRLFVHMNFNYGQLSDKDTVLNFDNAVKFPLFALLQIGKQVPQDQQVVVRVPQGSEEKESVSQQRVDFGVTGWEVFGVSCANQ